MAGLVLLGGATAGCGDDEDRQNGGERTVPVETATVATETLHETVTASGELRALETVELRTEATAPVERIHFEEGTRVERGQLLFTLDAAKLRERLGAAEAALEAAQARATLAGRTLERVATLHDRGSASDEELDRAETESRQANADVRRMEAEAALLGEQLDDATIRSPVGGQISQRLVDVGDFVEIGNPLATLYTTDPLEVAAGVPEAAMDRIRSGQELEVRVTALPEEVFPGRVTFVSPAVDPATRTVLVKGRVENSQGLLKPGTFASVAITTRTLEDRPVVPEETLVSTRTGYVVFVVSDRTAHLREVQVGLRLPGRAEIRSGLEGGETVVRTGQMSLADGDRVEVVESLAGRGAGAELPR